MLLNRAHAKVAAAPSKRARKDDWRGQLNSKCFKSSKSQTPSSARRVGGRTGTFGVAIDATATGAM